MQLNVLNDLAEAMKALDGKKYCCSCPIDTALPTYPKWNNLRCVAKSVGGI
jgi:hypothetical protein